MEMNELLDKYLKEKQEQDTMNILLILKNFIEEMGYEIHIEKYTYNNERKVVIKQDSWIDYIPLKSIYDLDTTKLLEESTECITD